MNPFHQLSPLWRKLGLVLIAGLLLALHLGSLLRYPNPSADEAWLTSRAWAFVHTGIPFGSLDTGISERLFDKYWLTNQWLITASQSILLSIRNAPDLLVLRAYSLFWGSILLIANWICVKVLFGTRSANLSTLLLSLSPAFLFSAHQVRYDIMATALAYTGFACFFVVRQAIIQDKIPEQNAGRPLWGFVFSVLGGLCLSLSVETHLNSLIFLPTSLILFITVDGRKFFRQIPFWGFLLGGIIGAGFYLIVHVFPDPSGFYNQFNLYLGPNHAVPLFTSLKTILNNFLDVSRLLIVGGSTLLVFSIASLRRLRDHPQKSYITLWIFTLCLIIFSALVIPHKNGHYAILVAPAIAWTAASFLMDFRFPVWQGKFRDYFYRISFFTILISFLAISLFPLRWNGYSRYQTTMSEVQWWVRPTDVIIGPQVYWLGLSENQYYSWEVLFLYNRVVPGSSLFDSFKEFSPDIFIIDHSLDILISDDIPTESEWYEYRLPRQALFEILDQKAVLIASISSPTYGPIWIYRFSW